MLRCNEPTLELPTFCLIEIHQKPPANELQLLHFHYQIFYFLDSLNRILLPMVKVTFQCKNILHFNRWQGVDEFFFAWAITMRVLMRVFIMAWEVTKHSFIWFSTLVEGGDNFCCDCWIEFDILVQASGTSLCSLEIPVDASRSFYLSKIIDVVIKILSNCQSIWLEYTILLIISFF